MHLNVVAHLLNSNIKGGVDHAFSPCDRGPGRSWYSSLARQRIHPNGGIHKSILNAVVIIAVGLVALDRFWAHE